MKWELVFERLKELRQIPDLWRSGQDQSLDWLHDQLQVEQGVLVADEVGLPFMLKKKFFGGREVWGAGQLDIGEFQRDAVTWLFEQGSSQNKERLAALKKLSPKAFDDDSNRQLFEGLVGQLVGEFDLLVIDEAHKGRAGDDVRDSEKKAETTRVTRLSRLLRNVLLRPEARANRRRGS
jgi:hypothetical protein